jgi:hypothetical protein
MPAIALTAITTLQMVFFSENNKPLFTEVEVIFLEFITKCHIEGEVTKVLLIGIISQRNQLNLSLPGRCSAADSMKLLALNHAIAAS